MSYRAMYKYELAKCAGVSPSTFRKWLNHLYIEELTPLGYSKTDSLLSPRVVKFLCDKLVISVNDCAHKTPQSNII